MIHDKASRTAGATQQNDNPIQLVQDVLSRLKFGAINLTVHEGKLVQVDVTERRRFT